MMMTKRLKKKQLVHLLLMEGVPAEEVHRGQLQFIVTNVALGGSELGGTVRRKEKHISAISKSNYPLSFLSLPFILYPLHLPHTISSTLPSLFSLNPPFLTQSASP